MKRLLVTALAVIVLGCVAVAGLSWQIGRDVRAISGSAVYAYGGEPVMALQRYVLAEERPLRERDRAVWALGQIGDPAALPTLETVLTGEGCRHDQDLCQHGIRKAIAGCRGATNMTAIFWRRH